MELPLCVGANLVGWSGGGMSGGVGCRNATLSWASMGLSSLEERMDTVPTGASYYEPSHLTSLLAVRRGPTPTQSFQDALHRPGLNVIMKPDTILAEAIIRGSSEEMQALRQLQAVGRLRHWGGSVFDEDLHDQLKKGDHVLVTTSLLADELIARDFMKTGICNFYKSSWYFIASSHCMIGQKDSPLTTAITPRITAMVETGLYHHWLAAQLPRIGQCNSAHSTTTVMSSLSLYNLWGMMVVLSCGLTVAMVVFCTELLVTKAR
ncbi:hypothetical protein O3P69_002104 [Scylla paramamosain]|uniref:Uncharacterized protein n=1 Tax=Scylla paramamosain TaxID=85552 RepID=A0AAW0V7Z4_SCYPA